jgi:2'-5' RNA ligase
MPHISLLRDAHKPPENGIDAGLLWPVHEFSLVLSETQNHTTHYRVVRCWGLT